MSLLEVESINTLYGDSHVLFDVSLRVEENEVDPQPPSGRG